MTAVPRPPLLKRVPPGVRSGLAWCGVVLFPFALVLAWLGFSPHPGVLELSLRLVVLALPAGLLRRWPLPGLAVMLLGFLLMGHTQSWNDVVLQMLILQAAVGYIAATRRPLVSVSAAAMVLVTEYAGAYVSVFPSQDVATNPFSVTFAVMVGLTAWILGNSVRVRRRYGVALREQAVTAERLRIARELHDMISHSIGIIAIQAGVGSRVIETQPAEARKALDTIEATSRETLAQLRRTLGSLRRAEAAPAEFDPAPGLADLDRLAASTGDAGVRVELRRLGRPRPVPADIDLSAYRIIQEALTNVVRHAATDACRVTVDYRDGDLIIEITDEGRGGSVGEAGFGIAGMRERVGMLHGEFSAGPRPEGGFAVSARLRLPA